MRSVFLAVCLLASTAQATENLGGGGAYGLVEGGLGTSGGTMTGPICWYDTSSSVCIDSTSPGTLKTYGSGATNNEDLTCDYETTADEIACTSSTGVTVIDYGPGLEAPFFESNAADPALYLTDSTAPGDASGAANIYFRANDDNVPTLETMARIALDVTDAADASEDADIVLSVMSGGSLTEMMRVDGDAGGVSIPATKRFYLDGGGDLDTFWYEHSEDTVRLYLGNTAGMWLTTVGHSLYHSTGRTSSRYSLAASENPGAMEVYRYDLSPTNGDVVGNIYFKASDATPANADYANIQGSIVDTTAGVEDGKLCLQADHNGTLTDELCVQGGANEGTYIPTTKKLFFDGGGDSDTYMYESSEDNLDFVLGGTPRVQFDTTGVHVVDNYPLYLGENDDIIIYYDETTDDALELWSTDTNGAGADGIVLSVPLGGREVKKTVEPKGAVTTNSGAYEDLTTDGGAGPFTTSGLIPDGAFLIGITTRVTTALATCTDYSVGDGSDADLYGVAGAVTQGTTTDNSDATANWANPQLAAGEVTITTTGTCDSGGVIRVVAHYFTVSAPSSN